jgi:hypothetical protein
VADPMSGRSGMLIRAAVVAVAILAAVGLVLPDVLRAAWIAAYGLAGGVLIVRRPGNSIGWLLAVAALSFTGLTDLTTDQLAAIQQGSAGPVETTRIWIGAMSGSWAFLAYSMLGLVFPSGHLPSGRWRRPILAVVAFATALTVLSMVHPRISVTTDGGTTIVAVPNPVAVAPDSPIWSVLPDGDLAFLPVLALLALSVGSVILRTRRSTGVVRLQMRWLAASLGALLLAISVGGLVAVVGGAQVGDVAWIPASVAFLTVPIAILIAVLRYRLLEIDRIISRTLGWGLSTGVIAVIFFGAVAALQALLVDVTQGETLAVAASTLLIAALFQPIRRRLQHAVDRRFDRTSVDRERVLAAVTGRLRDEVDLDTIQDHVIASASDVVRPTAIAIWLRPPATR